MGEIQNSSFSQFKEMKSVIMNVYIRDGFRVTFVVPQSFKSSCAEWIVGSHAALKVKLHDGFNRNYYD